MTNPTVAETADWKLGCYMEWRPKHHQEYCPACHGSGEVGGGFKDIEGARPCTNCHGTGKVTKPPSTPMPELPKLLVEHMRRAWFDFNNPPQQNKESSS